MNNRKRLTLRFSTTCFGIALGALVIMSLAGVARTVRAQHTPGYSLVYSFNASTGMGGDFPSRTIARDSAGNIYGTTNYGNNPSFCDGAAGCGAIFKISPNRELTVLHAFASNDPSDYFGPNGVIRDASGTLYGTTNELGTDKAGTVFKFTSTGSYGVLHTFAGGAADGSRPYSVGVYSAGSFYGTTSAGGGTGCSESAGCGTVYRATNSGQETVLYRFTGGADGSAPEANPILDAAGNLYGTTYAGGEPTCSLFPIYGCGTVWKLDTAGNLTVLYTFTGGTDGAVPDAGLVMDPSGNLYGTTIWGGNLSCGASSGCGVVFEINSSGTFSVLHAFSGGSSDGDEPLGTLFRDSAGNLYGTTYYGGDQSCGSGNGCGVVFKLDTSDNETVLHSFAGGTSDGEFSGGNLISNGKGTLYGTTGSGGATNGGTLFAVQE
jgi:uncharacterized repeat protein (TIGR03803 family)